MWKNFSKITVIALLVVASACGGDANDQAELDREMDLALADDSLAELTDIAQPEAQPEQPEPQVQQPQVQQPPPQARPQPRTQPPPQPEPEPEPVDPGPQYESMTVAGGTRVQVTLNQQLSTRTSQVGDRFTVTLSAPVVVGNRVALPAGSRVSGRVTAVQKSGGPGQEAILNLAFNTITVDGESYSVLMTVAEANPTMKARDNTAAKAGKIGIGAAAGAILGRVIGGNKTGTIVGGVIGAAAGTAIIVGSADSDAILERGSAMTLTLDGPLTVQRQI